MLLALDDNTTLIVLSALGILNSLVVGALGYWAKRHLKTPSGPTVGTQVESANALSGLAIGYLDALLKRHGIAAPPAAEAMSTAERVAKPLINGDPLPQPKDGS